MWESLIFVANKFDKLKTNKVMTINTSIGENRVALYFRTKIDSNEVMVDVFVNEVPLFYNLFPVLNEGFIHNRIVCDYFDGDFVFIINDENNECLPITSDNLDKMTLYYGFR